MYQSALLRLVCCWLCTTSFSLLLFHDEARGVGICSISFSPPGCCCCYLYYSYYCCCSFFLFKSPFTAFVAAFPPFQDFAANDPPLVAPGVVSVFFVTGHPVFEARSRLYSFVPLPSSIHRWGPSLLLILLTLLLVVLLMNLFPSSLGGVEAEIFGQGMPWACLGHAPKAPQTKNKVCATLPPTTSVFPDT